jgi:hypothetical protein
MMLAMALHPAAHAGEAAPPAAPPAGPALTGKERLSGKGADEQRVDNCKVPADRRGPKERPDPCDGGAGPAPSQ